MMATAAGLRDVIDKKRMAYQADGLGTPTGGKAMTDMPRWHRRALAIVVVTLLIASCGQMPSNNELYGGSRVPISPGITRFIDEEAAVVCWVFAEPYKGGLSCIPLVQTGLPRG